MSQQKIRKNRLTVFTPTYNRAYTLPRLFKSLQNQTNKNFDWLIIDDGSTDNTKELVKALKLKAKFQVSYIFKENEGKHSAINLMLDMIDSELVAIVDSDDYLSNDAVETILVDYRVIKDIEEVKSIYYLDSDFDGNIVGHTFAEDRTIRNANQYFINSGVKGDKFIVFKSKALKTFRFPVFETEKFIGETAVWIPLQRNSKSYFRNEAIYRCQYLEDGISKAGKKIRLESPLGGMFNSKVYIENDITLTLKFKNTILYICYGLFAKKKVRWMLRDFPEKWMLITMLPMGICLYCVWKRRYF